jgi:Ni/Co efflux regulator RcnB
MMKYMITAAVALSLLAGSAAMAQDDHHRDDQGGRGGGGREDRGGGPQGGGERGGGRGGPQAAPQAAPPQQNVPHNRAGQEVFQGDRRGGYQPQQNADRGRGPGGPPQQNFDRSRDNRDNRGGDNRGGDYRGGGDRHYGGRQDYRPGEGFNYRPGGYLRDRGWRGGQRFHLSPYRYPRGFGYQTWAFGAFLPSVYLAPDYTIGDYWAYGLPAPPVGFHWIRVGPDALLVRYGDGYVLDAAYGLFY